MDHAEFSQLHDPYGAAVGLNIDAGCGDRFSQWSTQETQDFLVIRADIDPNFMETRRNKLLWELVSTRMREIGYNRSPQQCKSKWKNLVTRYKGCETMNAEEMRPETFPFYNEMQIIFNARMQRMLWLKGQGGGDGGAAVSISRKEQAVVQISSNDEYEEDGHRQERGGGSGLKKKRKKKATENPGGKTSGNSIVNGLKEIMEEFMNQQMEMEMQWMKAYEEREERRRLREMEWRERMEALENERMVMMNWWREREEQRKVREEARAERRDALITGLLNKLRREGM